MKKVIIIDNSNQDNMSRIFTCPCKDGFHNIATSFPVWAYVVHTIDKFGEFVKVSYAPTGKTYSVPRIYIAIHGLKGKDLSKLGFIEASL